jgi:hypothetical protein
MAAGKYMLLRSMVLAAVRLKGQNQTPTQLLEGIVLGKFQSEITDGKTLIRINEAGGDTQFSLMLDLSPAEILALAMEALSWLQQQPDPDNPALYPPTIKRLRADFRKAVI